jgi:hypothetical protein
MKALSSKEYNNTLRGKVASIVIKHVEDPKRKQIAHSAQVKEFGQAKSSKIYNHIKGLI